MRRRVDEWVLLAVGAALLLGAVVARQPADTADRLFGEPLGLPRIVSCPAGETMAGFWVWGQERVMRVQLACRAPDGLVTAGAGVGQPWGAPLKLTCPDEHAMKAVAAQLQPRLLSIAPICAGERPPEGGGGFEQRCSAGQVPEGLRVRLLAGQVEAAGLLCGDGAR